MIYIKEYLEAVNYKVTDGNKFYWNIYPGQCYVLDYDEKWCSCSVVYGPDSNVVYEINVTDTANDRWYRWIMPDFVEKTIQEETGFGCDSSNYILLDVKQDIMEKLTAIAANKPYDDRVIMNIDLTDETFLFMAKQAHEQDITLNDYVTNLLIDFIAKTKADEEFVKEFIRKNT